MTRGLQTVKEGQEREDVVCHVYVCMLYVCMKVDKYILDVGREMRGVDGDDYMRMVKGYLYLLYLVCGY